MRATSEWLNSLKVGDEASIMDGGRLREVAVCTRVTAMYKIVGGETFRAKDGRRKGETLIFGRRIEPTTQEHRDYREWQVLLQRLRTACNHQSELLSLDQLRAMKAIIDRKSNSAPVNQPKYQEGEPQ